MTSPSPTDDAAECSSDEADPVVVVLAADENFALPLSVALYSLVHFYRGPQPLRIVVLDAGLSSKTRARLQRIIDMGSDRARIEWLVPDTSAFADIDRKLNARYNESLFYRLLIPELLRDTKKAIYLDSDVILHKDVGVLWKEALDGHPVLAVQERTVSCPVAGVAEWERLNIEPDAPYFNSGVLVMDLEQWRDKAIHWKTIRYLANGENEFTRVGDQEALNAILCDAWKALDPRWNALFYFSDEVLDEAYLSHFADAHPWRASWRHPAASAFVNVLRQNGWFSHSAYLRWQVRLAVQYFILHIKNITRPIRHRIGLRKSGQDA